MSKKKYDDGYAGRADSADSSYSMMSASRRRQLAIEARAMTHNWKLLLDMRPVNCSPAAWRSTLKMLENEAAGIYGFPYPGTDR